MSHILVCITPAPGHINPMLAVAQHLSGAGHHVTVLTGDGFKDKIVAPGLDFVTVTGIANFDYRRQEDFFPDKKNLRGMDLMAHYFKHLFGDTIPDQDRCIRQIMAKRPVDLVDFFPRCCKFWKRTRILASSHRPGPQKTGRRPRKPNLY